MVVGDLGADVIKVEAPSGDPVRQMAPPRFGNDATYFLAVNRHRRNVVADLRDAGDRAAIVRLLGAADAVVENFLPSQRATVHYDELRAAAPDAIWVTVTAASSGGPLADEPSFDLLAQARSGLMGVTGDSDGAPTKVGAPVADVVAGLYAAVGLVTGLFARASGRPGRSFEAPLLESAIATLVNQAQGFLVTGENPRRLGNDHPSIAPYGPVRTADGWLMLAVGTDGQFERLVEVLERPSSLTDETLATNDGRSAARDHLREAIEAVTATATTATWLVKLADAGVPAGPILDVAGALAQPQVANGDLIATTDAPAGSLRVVGSPLRVDGRRPPIRSGPRRLGQDDELLDPRGGPS
jgi:formyl-CoA transferase/CoA:oxalate CoA-transferase